MKTLRWFGLSLSLALCLGAFASNTRAEEKPADRVVVVKSKRTLTLYRGSAAIKSYKISLGIEPVGAKRRQGDHRTPEGNYVIDRRNPYSQFYKSLHISYPNAQDRERARKQRVSPGGDIMIHGLPNGMGYIGKAHLLHDWTDGCIALTNEEMDEVWRLVPNGTPIEIQP